MPITHLEAKFRVELTVEKRQHFYDVYSGEEMLYQFPGVTGALSIINKPALVPWAKREALELVRGALIKRLDGETDVKLSPVWIENLLSEASARPDKIKDDAADLGTRAHALIDDIIHERKLPEEISPDILPAVNAFRAWWMASGIELIRGDTKVASLIHKYGGSLDALGRREGQFIILDWKTSNNIYPEYALQVAAYSQAFFETYGIYCQEGIIVRFGKKLPIDFEAKTIRDLERSFQAFLRAKELKEHMAIEHFVEEVC